MPANPKILNVSTISESKIFCVEAVDLQFSNGEKRQFERLHPVRHTGAVIIAPVTEDNEILLVREYAVGIEDYTLALPKGLMEKGEEPIASANRELQEEIGFAAKNIELIHEFSLAPAYMGHRMHFLVARDLYESSLEGDEPEPIEVIPWPLTEFKQLLERPDFCEVRSIAAMYMLRDFLQHGIKISK